VCVYVYYIYISLYMYMDIYVFIYRFRVSTYIYIYTIHTHDLISTCMHMFLGCTSGCVRTFIHDCVSSNSTIVNYMMRLTPQKSNYIWAEPKLHERNPAAEIVTE
jgi:hypothetical protein